MRVLLGGIVDTCVAHIGGLAMVLIVIEDERLCREIDNVTISTTKGHLRGRLCEDGQSSDRFFVALGKTG